MTPNINDPKNKAFALIRPIITKENEFVSKYRRMLIRPINVPEEDFKKGFGEVTLYGCCLEANEDESKEAFIIRSTLRGCEPFLEILENDEYDIAKVSNLKTGEVYLDKTVKSGSDAHS